jgi:hypothetical protein
MVARIPQKHKKMVAPIKPVLFRETVKKVSYIVFIIEQKNKDFPFGS